MLCQDCPKKVSCSNSCPELESHLKQIEVRQREKLIGLPRYGKLPELISNIPLTKRERQILTLLGQGLSRKDICQLLEINRHLLRMHILNLKKKIDAFDPLYESEMSE